MIYKLQHEFGINAMRLLEVDMRALDFYSKNVEFFGEEVKGEKVLNTMIEMGYMHDKAIKTKN